MSNRLRWIATNGGPFVLAPQIAVSTWRGDRGTSRSNAANLSDYGRACEVDGFVGVVESGDHRVAVIGDEPAETTWLPMGFTGGIIAKWTYAPNFESAEESLLQLARPEVVRALPWASENVSLPVAEQRLLLFDAAIGGCDLTSADSISIPVPPGSLEIMTAIYEPTDEISFVLHSLGEPK